MRVTYLQIFAQVQTSLNSYKCRLMCLHLTLKASGKLPPLVVILIDQFLQMCIEFMALVYL
jgi:hypothetical protein